MKYCLLINLSILFPNFCNCLNIYCFSHCSGRSNV